MNSKLRTHLFICTALTIVLGFAAGFYVGNGSISFRHTQASEQVDMSAFWKVWDTINEKFVSASTTASVSDTDKMYGAISGLVQSLGDPYTVFFTPEEKEKFDESIEGTFEGVGMEVGIQDGHLTVVAPLKNSPAQKAGIESGDIIVTIDGKESTNMKVEEAVGLIRGAKGTVVTLGILKKGSEQVRDIKVTRDQINVPTLETEQKGDVFIIKLYSFGTTAKTEFKTAVQQFANSKKNKLILDMRGNPGGFLDAAVDISSWFLPAGKTVVSEDFGGGVEPKVFRSKGYTTLKPGIQMIVLIDEGSASASEIVAGALQEQGVARLVGAKSFGKGSVQELIDITSDTALKVTIARWLTPNGNSISLKGIEPDVEVKFDPELFKKSGTDTQLQKALELLK
jgi:carboxyl-terminal processing protease